MQDAGVRAAADLGADRMNAKIRAAQMMKVPYMLVVGDREVEEETVALRKRDGSRQNGMPFGEFQALVQERIDRSPGVAWRPEGNSKVRTGQRRVAPCPVLVSPQEWTSRKTSGASCPREILEVFREVHPKNVIHLVQDSNLTRLSGNAILRTSIWTSYALV
ncbi:MAG: His/Gly/Thr/Pro-type tRNA ligase C-terminal domain-containing protein [Caldilineaceae bacterium]